MYRTHADLHASAPWCPRFDIKGTLTTSVLVLVASPLGPGSQPKLGIHTVFGVVAPAFVIYSRSREWVNSLCAHVLEYPSGYPSVEGPCMHPCRVLPLEFLKTQFVDRIEDTMIKDLSGEEPNRSAR